MVTKKRPKYPKDRRVFLKAIAETASRETGLGSDDYPLGDPDPIHAFEIVERGAKARELLAKLDRREKLQRGLKP